MPEPFEPGMELRATTVQPTIAVPALDAVLRPWSRADCGHLSVALTDDQIQRWNLQQADTFADAEQWVDEWARRWKEKTGASWALVRRNRRDIPLGQVAFRSWFSKDNLAEISCWVVAGVRRRRIGTEATRALAEWAFTSTTLERLEIVHSVHNTVSCSVALRAGFQIEGIRRSLMEHLDGRHDMCQHSRIRSDDGRPPVPAANGVPRPRPGTYPDTARGCQ